MGGWQTNLPSTNCLKLEKLQRLPLTARNMSVPRRLCKVWSYTAILSRLTALILANRLRLYPLRTLNHRWCAWPILNLPFTAQLFTRRKKQSIPLTRNIYLIMSFLKSTKVSVQPPHIVGRSTTRLLPMHWSATMYSIRCQAIRQQSHVSTKVSIKAGINRWLTRFLQPVISMMVVLMKTKAATFSLILVIFLSQNRQEVILLQDR